MGRHGGLPESDDSGGLCLKSGERSSPALGVRAVTHCGRMRDTTAPEKKCFWLHLSARLSGLWDPPQFLSRHSHWSSKLKPTTYGWPTTRLIGPISPACNRYVQYLLTGTNPSVLNQHRWGYHIENLRIDTTLFPPFPSDGSTNPPK
jgi:hypothetical protein